MSTSLEKLCDANGLSYTRDEEGGVCVIASNHYPEASHSIKISSIPNGKVGILIIFPDCKVKEIADVDEFCEELQKTFVSEIHLSFDAEGGYFFMYGTTEEAKIKEYINKLAHDCDLIKPLLVDVGERGYCNQYGPWLAHLMPSEFGPYMN